MPGRQNNAVVTDACARRLRALESYVPASAQMALDGEKREVSEVLAFYQSCLDSRAEVARLRGALKAAMDVRTEKERARHREDAALKRWVLNEFGVESKEAIDFGFPPPRVAARSVENKANAVALARATRQARRTMGAKQKRAVVGIVPAPTAGAEGGGAEVSSGAVVT